MDEIGRWNTGAVTDAEDPQHDSLRRQVLWASLLAGGAGVEWYFGAHHPHNDLNSEDWRQRANLWRQTRHALEFFQRHLPYWEMEAADELTESADDYCFAKPGAIYAIYVPADEVLGESIELDLRGYENSFQLRWYDPVAGGPLQRGSIDALVGGKRQSLGNPPRDQRRDWVILVNGLTDGRQ